MDRADRRHKFGSSPAPGDIDNADAPKSSSVRFYYNRGDGHRVFAWQRERRLDGTGWPVTTAATPAAPALGDLGRRSVPEVVVSSATVVARTRVAALKGQATHVQQHSRRRPGGVAIVADFNGDGQTTSAPRRLGFPLAAERRQRRADRSGHKWLSGSRPARSETSAARAEARSSIASNARTTRAPLRAYDMPAPGKTPPCRCSTRDGTHRAGRSAVVVPAATAGAPVRTARRRTRRRTLLGRGPDRLVYRSRARRTKGQRQRTRTRRVVGMGRRFRHGYYCSTPRFIFPFGDAKSYGLDAGTGSRADHRASRVADRSWLLPARPPTRRVQFATALLGSTGGHHLNSPIISIPQPRWPAGSVLARWWCVQRSATRVQGFRPVVTT